MKKFAIVSFLAALAAARIGPVAASSVCPSPLPNCGTVGNASLLSGSFACIEGDAFSGGNQGSGVSLLTFTPGPVGSGTGNITGGEHANNQNSSTSGTYKDFHAGNGTAAPYCINADNVTGYIFAGDCPAAFGLTSGHTLLRLIQTNENSEESIVCRHQ